MPQGASVPVMDLLLVVYVTVLPITLLSLPGIHSSLSLSQSLKKGTASKPTPYIITGMRMLLIYIFH